MGVQSIILIEDSVRFYSAYLPIIYTELMRHTQSLISEGVNPAHRLLRRRARPKILLCTTYEEAWAYFEKYHDNVLGVISDMEFPKGGGQGPGGGGAPSSRRCGRGTPTFPILLQSNDPENKTVADALGASFLMKNSPTLLYDLRDFMKKNFSFGDFVFRLPDGTEVGRARDLRSLEEMLHVVPGESLSYHGERNHFSNWLKARTEFLLAYKLRPRKVSDYQSIEDIRRYLIGCLRDLRTAQQQGNIVDFDPQTFDPHGELRADRRGFARRKGERARVRQFDHLYVSSPEPVRRGSHLGAAHRGHRHGRFRPVHQRQRSLGRGAQVVGREEDRERPFSAPSFPAETTRGAARDSSNS